MCVEYYRCKLVVVWFCSIIALGHLQHDDPCALLVLDFTQFLVGTGCTAVMAWYHRNFGYEDLRFNSCHQSLLFLLVFCFSCRVLPRASEDEEVPVVISEVVVLIYSQFCLILLVFSFTVYYSVLDIAVGLKSVESVMH